MKETTIDKDYRMQCAQLIGEISSLAFMVNTFTNYCIFIDFSGHVDWFSISVSEGKERYKNRSTEDRVLLDSEKWGKEDERRTIQNLIDLKSQFRKILLKKEIKYGGLRYTVREERDYHLIG